MHKKDHITIHVAAYSGEAQLFRVLCMLCLGMIVAYLYLVSLSIMNVIVSREAGVESEQLRATVSSLEEEYFALSRAVNPDLGATLGLFPVEKTHFVQRAHAVAARD